MQIPRGRVRRSKTCVLYLKFLRIQVLYKWVKSGYYFRIRLCLSSLERDESDESDLSNLEDEDEF